jgi:hydroxypyruvate isomerase
MMTRRLFVPALGAVVASAIPVPAKGRLKQSVTKGVFNGRSMTLDDMCREAANLGLYGFDLIQPQDFPTLKKYGLVPTMIPNPWGGTIKDALNRKENHERIRGTITEAIDLAAAAGCPNVITFSGNRNGMSDQEGADNCVLFLNSVKAHAEDKGVTICMELLNSKVNHPDYMCDHTAWGVGVMKRVNSPHVKLLYDIYHMQIMEGDLIRTIREDIDFIGHFHTGGNPGRHELDDTQEVNWHAVASAIADTGYSGFFSHEFIPVRTPPINSLEQAYRICSV